MEGHLWLQEVCRINRFDISADQLALLSQYADQLFEWNQKINLISRRDETNIWSRHILGSIGFLFSNKFNDHSSIIDVGTGGGLPGIPLAICYPHCKFILLDSIRKKIMAVSEIVSALNLPNVTVLSGRAEELALTAVHRGKYDYVVARAVAPVVDVVRWCKQFVRTPAAPVPSDSAPGDRQTGKLIPRGSIVLLKGGEVSSEVEMAKVKFHTLRYDIYPVVIEAVGPDDLPDKKLIVIGSGKT
jgi:16S rRNA (guanine527-N7)-methyltransferase